MNKRPVGICNLGYKQKEKLEYLKEHHLATFLLKKQIVLQELKDKYTTTCCCGTEASDIHKRTCRYLKKLAEKKTINVMSDFFIKK